MRALSALFVLAALVVAGCISPGTNVDPADADAGGGTPITRVAERAGLPFRTDDVWSHTLTNGTFAILPGVGATVSFAAPLGQGVPDQLVHMGLFFPEIEGCDWSAESLPDHCKVPVVADVGPYYGEPTLGDVHATEPANRLGKFLIDNLVPHGYAIAQVSVPGTGDSTGCNDLMGEIEQAGVQASVEFLGSAPWSNGAVALIGRSYDGSTPWEAAAGGSPYLKTIVPISGLYGQHDLMWRNGSAESRGPALLWGLYWTMAYTGNEGNPTLAAQQAAENSICPDTMSAPAFGAFAYATGSKDPAGYWGERSFKDEVLANYEGSVYFIHGMQDWNVDPHMAFPFYNELEAKGLEMKGLFGQWGHMYPDRPGEHAGCGDCTDEANEMSVRWDWAQDLLEWFDHYLKGTGAKPELHVEMQDHQGRWRIEETWPPADAAWAELALGEAFAVESGDGLILPGSNALGAGLLEEGTMLLAAEARDADLLLVGQPQLLLTVTPAGAGGQVYAELRDLDADGHRLGHAIMDLRYAAGGETMQPVVPGMPLEVHMEFFPMDAVLPEGHRLGLYLASTGQDYLPAATPGAVQLDLGASALRLPVIERGPEDYFQPAAGASADVATGQEP